MEPHPTRFEERREAEGKPKKEHIDYELHQSRLARHVPTSSSLWHMEESFITEEDYVTGKAFGRSGVFNQETQENMLGLDMNSSKDGEKPAGFDVFGPGPNGKPQMQTYRQDTSPTGIYMDKSKIPKDTGMWDSTTHKEMKNLFEGSVAETDMLQLNLLRQQMEAHRIQKESDKMAETSIKHGARGGGGGPEGGPAADPWNTRGTILQDPPRGQQTADELREIYGTKDQQPVKEGKYKRTAKTIEADKEEAYAQELKKRHQQKPRPFGSDVGLDDIWGQH